MTDFTFRHHNTTPLATPAPPATSLPEAGLPVLSLAALVQRAFNQIGDPT